MIAADVVRALCIDYDVCSHDDGRLAVARDLLRT